MFLTDDTHLSVCVNGDEHLRIVTCQGASDAEPSAAARDVKQLMSQFDAAIAQLQKCLEAVGAHFMHSKEWGWLGTSLSDLGTGVTLTAVLRLPELTSRLDWAELYKGLGLEVGEVDFGEQTRQKADAGFVQVTSGHCKGSTEIQIANRFIEAVAQLAAWEVAAQGSDEVLQNELEIHLGNTVPPSTISLLLDELADLMVEGLEIPEFHSKRQVPQPVSLAPSLPPSLTLSYLSPSLSLPRFLLLIL